MPLTRIDSAFLDLDNLGGITFDEQQGTPTFKVDATNHRVGIGHNSPQYKLDIVGDINISSGSNFLIDGSQISTANINGLQNTLNLKASLASPALTGTPTAPTATSGTNTTQIATTAFVSTALADLVDSAPGTLDTLNELAAALGDDANFSTTITNSIATKLAASAYTAADVLTKIKTVDGTGSGLDADLLDGVQGASFVRNDVGSQQVQSYLTINNSGNFSVLEFEDASNVQRTHVYHANSGGYAGIGVFDSSGANRKDLLLYQNGTITWNNNTVWHAGNDGSGSGLDADLLDGFHSYQGSIRDARADGDVTPTNFTDGAFDFRFTDDIAGSTRTWDSVLTMKGWSGSTYRVWQLMGNASTSGDTDTNLYFREGIGSSWGSLQKIWTSGNDGAGSGLDADLLDGVQGSSFLRSDAIDTFNAAYMEFGGSAVSSSEGGEIRLTSPSGQSNGATVIDMNGVNLRFFYANSPHKGAYLPLTSLADGVTSRILTTSDEGAGNGLDADLLDGVHGSSYLRSDIADTATGSLTIGGTTTEKIILSGSSQPYIRFKQGTVNVGWVGWQNAAKLVNQSTNRQLSVGSDLQYYNGSSYVSVWHASNDGSGSGLDADTVDGLQAASFLRSDAADNASGFIHLDGGFSAQKPSTSWTSNYIGVSSLGQLYSAGSYWTSLVSNGYRNSSGTWTSHNANGNTGAAEIDLTPDGNIYFRTDATKANGSSTIPTLRAQISSSGAFSVGGNTVWHAGNDGAGSGLDADTVDGIQASSFIRSDANDTVTGKTTWSVHATDAISVNKPATTNYTGITFEEVNDPRYLLYVSNVADGRLSLQARKNGAGFAQVFDVGITGDWTFRVDPIYNGGTFAKFFDGSTAYTNFSQDAGFTSYYAISTGSPTGGSYFSGIRSLLDGDKKYGWELVGQAQNNITEDLFVRKINNQTYGGWSKVWTAASDGSGSGLDADTLDGVQASSFLRSDANDTLSAIITGHASNTEVLRIRSSSYSTKYIYYGGWSSANSNDISRIRTSGNLHIDSPANGHLYFNWYASNRTIHLGNTGQIVRAAGSNTVWHAGNDGSGSGLDADTLDGINSASFLRSDATDTATGFVHFSGGSSSYKPAGSWTSWYYGISNMGQLYTPGSYWISLTCNGYRNSSGTWTSHNVNNNTGASEIDLTPNGYIYFRTDSTKANGSATTPTLRAVIDPNGVFSVGGNTVWHAGNDGSGSGLDADTLDGVQGSSFLRSDVSDTYDNGQLDIRSNSQNGHYWGVGIEWSSGWKHTNTNSWGFAFRNSAGILDIYSSTAAGTAGATATYKAFRIGGSSSLLQYDGNNIWHAGNDGSGSGLDADLLDGAQPNVSASNNTIVKRHSSGYIFANYFNTTPNDVSSGITKICCETGNDGYIRHATPDAVRGFIDDGRYLRSDASDIYGSTSAGNILTIQCVSGRVGNTSSGSQFPLEIKQNTVNKDAAITFHIGGDYAAYFGLDGTTNDLFWGGWSRGATKYRIWHAANDGAGTGLDADTLDGVNSGSFLRSDAADTATGTLTVRDIKFTAGYHLQRSDHHSGHLEGSYNNVGANSYKSNPIYTIGSSYNPSDAALGNMYGIGYTHTNATFVGGYTLAGASGWGQYVAADGDARIFLCASQGDIYMTGSVTGNASDIRLKTNIIAISDPIEKIKKIRGVEFDWVEDITSEYDFHPSAMHETGVIAQEVQEAIPDAVVTAPFSGFYAQKSGTDHNFLTVKPEKIIPLLIEAIKDQQKQIDDLIVEIQSIKQENN